MSNDHDTQSCPTVVARECKFVIHIPKQGYESEDVHLIKETLHYSDKTTKPAIRLLKNYKRPYWITKPSFRDHIQKKEYEHVDKLMKFECTQSDLRREVARSLNKVWSNGSIRDLQESPYLYGTSIESTVFIKHMYKSKYPEYISPCTVAGFDVETDIFSEDKTIIIASMVYNGEAIIAVTKAFIGGVTDSMAQTLFSGLVTTHLKGDIDINKVTFKIVKDDLMAIKECFDWAHTKKPDMVAIWNMDFDLSRIMETFERHGEDPAQWLSDPEVPKQYRYCKYVRGSTSKITASGVFKPKPPEEQWHTLYLSASFYVIDPMGTYRQLRITGQKEPSYALDAMLNKYLKRRKLTMGFGEGLAKKKWHEFMQQEQKFAYCVYNLYDSLSILQLDRELQDMFTVYSSAGYSPYHRFNSQPKKIEDKYFFYCLEKRGFVLGTIPPQVVEDETAEDLKADKRALERQKLGYDVEVPEEETNGFESSKGTLGLSGWVLTLDPQNSVLGLQIAQDDPSLHTNIRLLNFDSDATAAYPTVTDTCNVSKSTTTKELIDVEGIDKEVFRMQNLNFILGQVNALEYSVTMHKLPKPYEMLKLFSE